MPNLSGVACTVLLACLVGCSSENTAVLTCSASPVVVTEAGSLASASDNGVCEGATSLVTWGVGAPGSACTDPTQCRPTCCACTTAGRSALTSWCNHGVCAAGGDVCCALAGTATNSCGD